MLSSKVISQLFSPCFFHVKSGKYKTKWLLPPPPLQLKRKCVPIQISEDSVGDFWKSSSFSDSGNERRFWLFLLVALAYGCGTRNYNSRLCLWDHSGWVKWKTQGCFSTPLKRVWVPDNNIKQCQLSLCSLLCRETKISFLEDSIDGFSVTC